MGPKRFLHPLLLFGIAFASIPYFEAEHAQEKLAAVTLGIALGLPFAIAHATGRAKFTFAAGFSSCVLLLAASSLGKAIGANLTSHTVDKLTLDIDFALLLPLVWICAVVPPWLYHWFTKPPETRGKLQISLATYFRVSSALVVTCWCLMSWQILFEVEPERSFSLVSSAAIFTFAVSSLLLIPKIAHQFKQTSSRQKRRIVLAGAVLAAASIAGIVFTPEPGLSDFENVIAYQIFSPYDTHELLPIVVVVAVLSFFTLEFAPAITTTSEKKPRGFFKMPCAIGVIVFVVAAASVSWRARQLQADRNAFDTQVRKLEKQLLAHDGDYFGPMCVTCSHRGVYGLVLHQSDDETLATILADAKMLDERWARLDRIHLNKSNITDKALSNFRHWSDISELDLSNTQISGEGFSSLSNLKLNTLDLRGLDLTQADWESLDTSRLQYLDISHSRVSPSFRKFRARCDLYDFKYKNTRITRQRTPAPWR